MSKKPTMKPFLSMDLETTGLADICEPLEVGAIYINEKLEVKEFRCFIDYENMHTERFALNMNYELIGIILGQVENKENVQILKLPEFCIAYLSFLEECQKDLKRWEKENNRESRSCALTYAGKNVISFDHPKLLNIFKQYDKAYLKRYQKLIQHRSLDVGSMYAQDYFENVPLETLCKDILGKIQTHVGMDDSEDVVDLILIKYGHEPIYNRIK